MNKNVAEAARRIFGNLPHSHGRSGNKALRKNIIGRKIAEVRTDGIDVFIEFEYRTMGPVQARLRSKLGLQLLCRAV